MNTSFQKTVASDEWYTPKEIIDCLGEFDIDPCAPMNPLWPTAKAMFNKVDNGLAREWGGVEYGSILHIHNHSLRSFAKSLRITATASASFSGGRETKSFRRLCLPVRMPFFSSASGFGSTSRAVSRGRAADAIQSYSLLAKRTPMPFSTAGLRAYMCH